MARRLRLTAGDLVYHVLNRANAKRQIFKTHKDYAAFESVLLEAHDWVDMRMLAYCVMPNHWHLVLWPYNDGDLSEFMRWLTVTHSVRWQMAHNTLGSGHLYQAHTNEKVTEYRDRGDDMRDLALDLVPQFVIRI